MKSIAAMAMSLSLLVSASAQPSQVSASPGSNPSGEGAQPVVITRSGSQPPVKGPAATLLNWELGKTEPRIQYIPPVVRFLGYDPALSSCTTLPERLSAKRRSPGWTQKEATRNPGIDHCIWSNWENGSTIMATTHRQLIARFLGIPEQALHAVMRKRWNDTYGRPTPN